MEKMKRLPDGQTLRRMEIGRYPQWLGRAAAWFHEKWHIPEAAYRESMEESLLVVGGVPRWYLVLDDEDRIVAGAGVIENDFHTRKDLRPNLCALYVEECWRGQGIARFLLDTAREDMGRAGIPRLYLITDHENFYEKCGWEFLTMVKEEGGGAARMYQATALEADEQT